MSTDTGRRKEVLPGMVTDGFVEVPQAAEFLSLSRATVYKLMDDGQLAYAKFGRSRRIPKRALLEYAERRIVQR
jgi:excisionase family DNA binding protein